MWNERVSAEYEMSRKKFFEKIQGTKVSHSKTFYDKNIDFPSQITKLLIFKNSRSSSITVVDKEELLWLFVTIIDRIFFSLVHNNYWQEN